MRRFWPLVLCLLGGVALGLALGFAWGESSGRSPLTEAEIGDLEVIPRRNASAPGGMSFGDFPCTGPCALHVAGFRWAKKARPRRADDCARHLASAFAEGCFTYLQLMGREPDGVP